MDGGGGSSWSDTTEGRLFQPVKCDGVSEVHKGQTEHNWTSEGVKAQREKGGRDKPPKGRNQARRGLCRPAGRCELSSATRQGPLTCQLRMF